LRINKITGILIVLIAIIMLLLLPFKHKIPKDLRAGGYPNNGHQGCPSLICLYDSRSEQAVEFIQSVLDYIDNKGLRVAIGLICLNKRPANFRGPFEAWEKARFDGYYLPMNIYYLFDKSGKFVKEGSLLDYQKILRSDLDELFGIEDIYQISSDIRLGESIGSSVFAETVGKTYLTRSHTCYVVYENICLGCDSGYSLLEFEKLIRIIPDFGFYYISVSDYSKVDVARFKRDNKLELDILLPNKALMERWKEIAGLTNKSHPLKGMIFALNIDGRVEIVTKDLQSFYNWLGSLNKKEE
jgi:hypothetical protein